MQNPSEKKIFIASDHAGFELKDFLIKELINLGFNPLDLGCENPKTSVDYPDFAKKLCLKIRENSSDFGILICGSGIGISIAANRFKHIRAALCYNLKSAKLAREHNDANVICLGGRILKHEPALAMVKAFLATQFKGGRHEARIEKLSR